MGVFTVVIPTETNRSLIVSRRTPLPVPKATTTTKPNETQRILASKSVVDLMPSTIALNLLAKVILVSSISSSLGTSVEPTSKFQERCFAKFLFFDDHSVDTP